MQRINAAKNVLTALANLVSGMVFIVVAHVAWIAVGLIAGGSMIGGLIGARIGRKLPPIALRAVIVLVGPRGNRQIAAHLIGVTRSANFVVITGCLRPLGDRRWC